MFATRSELLEKIRLGKDSFLELKQVRFSGNILTGPKRDDLADELAAFANSKVGGTLLLGVSDKPREVTGIRHDQLGLVENLIQNVCEDSIKPPCHLVTERIYLPDSNGTDRPVVCVKIPPSPSLHESPGGYFRRVSASKRPIPPDQLARESLQRRQGGLVSFDETLVHGAVLSDLDESLWKRFITSRSTDEPEILMGKLVLANQDRDEVWIPTVAGVLMTCRQPQIFLGHAFIQAVAYRGKRISPRMGVAYQRDAQDITGPLDQQIWGACDFIRKNMQVAAIKNMSGGRRDIPQFDMLAVFEAIVNAVAHRDYSMAGSQIRLRLFDDRLELYIPGPLANSMTPGDMPFRHVSRNVAITNLLARCPVERDDFRGHRERIMDKRGEGVHIILDYSEELSGKIPEYHLFSESELRLTIYAADPSQM